MPRNDFARRLLELSPAPTLLIDSEGTLRGANAPAGRMFGRPPEQLEGQLASRLFGSSDRRAWSRFFRRCIGVPDDWPSSERLDISARAADGTNLGVTVHLQPWNSAAGLCVVASLHDVTKFRESETELRASENRFRIVSHHTADVIQEVNFETGEMWLGDGIDELMGFPPGGFPRTLDGWFGRIHPEDRDRVQATVQNLAHKGIDEWHISYRMRAADGSYRHWLDHGTITEFAEDGRPIRGIGAAQDITETVVREQQLQSALAELEAAREKLFGERVYLEEEISRSLHSKDIVGTSESFRHVISQVLLVAQLDSTVLIQGETGTGKELLARLLHRTSSRKDRPLIKVNCAALPDSLIESELFGHEKGAFSGATAQRTGRFELADSGTLFLDEIGEIPLELQAKLLQVLQSGEFERLGSSRTLKTDVRIIAATNRDLLEAVKEGRFRDDLYYRLAVFPIEVPPLRDRRSDIHPLAIYFLSHYNATHGKSVVEIPKATMAALEAYDWPGNVRELENVIERGLILSPGATLRIDAATLRPLSDPESGAEAASLAAPDRSSGHLEGGTLEQIQRAHIVATLEACSWKVKGRGNAAERLGLNEATLRARMKKLGIERPPSP